LLLTEFLPSIASPHLLRALDALGTGDATPFEASRTVREALVADGPAFETVYAALRNLIWRTLTSRAFGEELTGWFELLRHAAALANRAHGPLAAARIRVFSDLIAQSARFAELHPVREVLARKHTAVILRRLASSFPLPVRRADLQTSTALADANLSRVLAILTSRGLICRVSSGRQALFQLTESGRQSIAPARVPVSPTISLRARRQTNDIAIRQETAAQ
jgi:DNA-binding HxlR family transcriptional regulator